MNNSRLPNVLIVISINIVILNTVFILSFAKETQSSSYRDRYTSCESPDVFRRCYHFLRGPAYKKRVAGWTKRQGVESEWSNSRTTLEDAHRTIRACMHLFAQREVERRNDKKRTIYRISMERVRLLEWNRAGSTRFNHFVAGLVRSWTTFPPVWTKIWHAAVSQVPIKMRIERVANHRRNFRVKPKHQDAITEITNCIHGVSIKKL